ncbi:MAG: hypothetical protein ABR568_09830 [Pyrinomonadaceae bacterium]
MSQILSLFELGNDRNVLAGAIPGKSMLGKLITAVRPPTAPEPVLLSFDRVDVATGSFLRESVFGFRDYCTKTQPNLYPVVANANEVIVDELEFLLRLSGDALFTCIVDEHGKVESSHIIGQLNDKQRLTFDAVLEAREADATTLQRKYGQTEQIQITGWNNRLSSLVVKGILMEIKKGRSKVYRPVLE